MPDRPPRRDGAYARFLRGTGEGFAANIGGRIIGTAAAFITLTLATVGGRPDPARMAMMGAVVAGAYVLIGAILTFWLPEPAEETEEHAPPAAAQADRPAAVQHT